MTLIAQPPAVAFAFLLPGLAIHVTFGVLAGLIVPAVIRAFEDNAKKGRPEPSNEVKESRHEQAHLG